MRRLSWTGVVQGSSHIRQESVVAMMLQMDEGCSFNLPIRYVVFNRVREVDFDADDR